MRRPDARSAQIGTPEGISQCLHVSLYSGEPRPASLASNLFAKDDWREALANEAAHFGPEVSGVVRSGTFAGDGEGLARTTSGPNRFLCWPSGELEGMAPSSYACEKMNLGIAGKVTAGQVRDRFSVNVRWWDGSGCRQIFQPERRERFNLIMQVH